MKALLLALALALLGALPRAQGSAAFEAGVTAYRAADYAAADEHWRAALAEPLSACSRASVLYDLGNSAWRAGRRGEALGWYHAALLQAPRHKAARANLAHAREELGLEPADAGSLVAFARAALSSFTRGEAALAALGAALLLFALMLVEALRGGRLWRNLVLLGALLAALAAGLWILAERRAGADPYLVIATPSVGLSSEPRADLPAIASLAAETRVARIDALDGWLRVETEQGVRGWAPEGAFFGLRR